ncbi:MAG: nucleoside deaminase [Cryomorphaceae bacterium]|jgi:tRNA(adenine34) deaminase|nr:nucleoside deaminase [Cryomorphaceae bacterium]MBT7659606.1 nucleoside deaminase [Bacteroidota bacterium]MCO4791306.1 nucleoside deaminase [Flavobacteriales bacterium]MDA7721484.1 nucleoside deaminase [Schleiferiaceae bacterium]MBL6682798.1 nucleoside deaminase [Cryomorphaceae bacterium]
MIDLNDHNVYMRAALAEAQVAAEAGEVPVGAVIVAAGRIIARSHNLTELLVDVTAHAEIQAITAASNYLGNKYLQKCTLYVTLEPCPMCAGALFWSQMGHVVFGASDEKRGYQKHGGPLHPKTKMTSGILADECAQLLTDFFANKRH